MMLWWLAWLAAAEPLVTVEGAALTIAPCTEDPAADCWERTARARRFTTDPRLGHEVVEVDVRLGWQDGALLVRAAEVPPGTRVEVGVHPAGQDGITRMSGMMLSEGVGRLDLLPALQPGELRSVRVGLIREDGQRFTWAPAGEGTTEDRALAVIAAHPPRARPAPVLARDRGVLEITAAGASQVRLRELDPSVIHPREALLDPPLSMIGSPPLRVPEPLDRGQYAVEAIWTADGKPSQVRQERVVLPGTVPAGLEHLGLLPAPRDVRLTGDRLAGEELRRICVQDDALRPAADLLAEELIRLGGPALPVDRCRAGRHRIALDSGGADGSFELLVRADRVEVTASSRAAATWAALAVVDLLVVHDLEPPTAVIHDQPDLPERTLVHRIDGVHRAPRDLDEHIAFLRRVVARGRYTAVVLVLRGGYQYTSHPELAQTGALSEDELRRLLDTLDGLGVEAIPGLNSPGHADWLLRAHPELREDQNGRLICTRHPDTWPLLRDVIDELIEVFDARRVHLGGDETWWGSERHGPHERCPRCASTPRPILFAEHVQRELAYLREREVGAMLWSDMLTERWNGATEDVFEARARLDLQRVDLLAWTDLGEGASTLGDLRVHQVATGLHPARTRPLASDLPLAGAGIALFVPRPWQLEGWNVARHRALWSHSPSVVLAGVLGWRREVAASDPDVMLLALADHPALRPGARPLGRADRWIPAGEGERTTLAWEPPELPPGERPDEVRGEAGEAVRIPVERPLSRVGLLWALDVDRDAEIRLEAGFHSADSRAGPPAASLRIVYDDDSEDVVPLVLGRDVWAPTLEPGALALWTAQAVVPVTTARTPFPVPDEQRALWVHDVDAGKTIRELVIEPNAGVSVVLGGALGWEG